MKLKGSANHTVLLSLLIQCKSVENHEYVKISDELESSSFLYDGRDIGEKISSFFE